MTDGSSFFKPAAISGHDPPKFINPLLPRKVETTLQQTLATRLIWLFQMKLSLGFTNHYIVNANGFSGGLWLLWNCNNLLTVVYAHPCPGIRKFIWTYLDGVSDVAKLPWLVAGDFNEIIVDSKKKGGIPTRSQTSFADWTSRNHLMDLGFSGAEFTWCKKNIHGETIWERLDRGLCSIDWRQTFLGAYVRHLPRTKSNHYPLLISMNSA
ncbi:unnamed protein product [Prunus armeniaca]